MGKIVQLDTHLANMIAAGEVVERPSSVVKELVENAIDAGSTSITINLLESGTKLIEVIDNGCGMSMEDAKLCFERHATSKIKNEYDLFRIATLGFRGEAIPSIASVSKFSLYTSDGNEATNVNYNAGKLVSVTPCAMNRGTKIDVENLFFNVPARLKYLRSLKTELNSISYLISKFILANPKLSFKLTNDGKVIYKTTGTDDLVEVFGELYGLNVARNLLTDSWQSEGYKLEATIGKNMISRSNNMEITTIINGRFIRSSVISDAVVQAYRTLIPEGRYPIALIRIDIDPLLIDVNVHPSKMTIKIANEREIGSLITSRLRSLLEANNLIPDADTNIHQEGYKKESLFTPTMEVKEELVLNKDSINEEKEIHYNDAKPSFNEKLLNENNKIFSFKDLNNANENNDFSFKDLNNANENNDFSFKDLEKDEKKDEVISNVTLDPLSMKYSEKRLPKLNYIGQIHGTYLIFEAIDGMYIMDQHAAAERINYEYYYNIMANPPKERIQMLVPLNVELTKEEFEKCEELIEQFNELGFRLEPSGPQSYFIREIPTWVHLEDADELIHDLLADFKENLKEDIMRYRDWLSKQISCKASIKANHTITEKEVLVLVERLSKCNAPFTCPHGRPTIVRYTKLDLEKMFMRVL